MNRPLRIRSIFRSSMIFDFDFRHRWFVDRDFYFCRYDLPSDNRQRVVDRWIGFFDLEISFDDFRSDSVGVCLGFSISIIMCFDRFDSAKSLNDDFWILPFRFLSIPIASNSRRWFSILTDPDFDRRFSILNLLDEMNPRFEIFKSMIFGFLTNYLFERPINRFRRSPKSKIDSLCDDRWKINQSVD